MKKSPLLYKAVNGTTDDGSYDFLWRCRYICKWKFQ